MGLCLKQKIKNKRKEEKKERKNQWASKTWGYNGLDRVYLHPLGLT